METKQVNEVTVEGKVAFDFSNPDPLLDRRLYVDIYKLGEALLQFGPMSGPFDVVLTIRRK